MSEKVVAEIYHQVQVHHNKLEVLLKGNTGPYVVILTGMGCSFDEWHEVTEVLGVTNRVLMYHRPGLGESELGVRKRNTEATVQELYELLAYYEINEPVYLVGHSYGGLSAQHFARLFPDKVAGMVLVDSTSTDLARLDELDLPMLDEESDEKWIEKCLRYAAMDQEQLRKIIKPSLTDQQKKFPKTLQNRLIDFQVNPLLYKAMASEIQCWKQDAKVIQGLGEFPDVPLIVMGRDKEWSIQSQLQSGIPEWELRCFEEMWEDLITKQAELSTCSELIFTERAGHSVYLDRADCVIEWIYKVMRQKVNLQ
ncbi:alpha/beta fold hydrolase [Bacillus sp. KH172YL63]|uniref:alpha/beta fold hydrolase n=1 Tax=Bacillus sp. KH172YL63 TaxID=2709784 RepID=UPI0013E4B2B4|nr:alpha/beta hydrolase [Bacillus sp. KH172YL63]BCB02529.1 hydrolase [Bacillus sp. KH172YL63]